MECLYTDHINIIFNKLIFLFFNLKLNATDIIFFYFFIFIIRDKYWKRDQINFFLKKKFLNKINVNLVI